MLLRWFITNTTVAFSGIAAKPASSVVPMRTRYSDCDSFLPIQ